MSMSGDPVLERVRAIEDDFADAMSRMYGVGNELARLRARLATEANPEQWTPVEAPVETPVEPLVTTPVVSTPAATVAAPVSATGQPSP
ncbi:hypothetical protein, partial [Janibacter anophelis]|uniref:hypothetical protein n=1 Tax=Janibacter anophelis TaxID=319054 RepID=UPI0019628D96